ncbi:MAG: helicase-related protein, partial [Leptolyngbyaceae bacterium]|nr:helicase-related protein [Leptolyngbyaceae bacterium]
LVQWGETFRPAYYRLGAVRPALLQTKPAGTRIAIAAFTATANPQAQQTIQRILQLSQPEVFQLSPYRSNLALSVRIAWTPRQRRQQMLKFIQARPGQAGLIYVRTRRDSETLAEWLTEQKLSTTAYHAGLSPSERRSIETDWISDKTQFVVCTCAFGMGINKPNVRWVVNFHAPSLLSEYVQEVGRAGRDGKPSQALTLISEPTGWLDPEDQQRRKFFEEKVRSQQQVAQQLAGKLPRTGEVTAVSRQFRDGAIALSLLHGAGKLHWQDPFHYVMQAAPAAATASSLESMAQNTGAAQQMTQYLQCRECRWQFLLKAFGFTKEAQGLRCGQCDNCCKQK